MTPEGSILGRTMRGAGWVVAWRMLTRLLGLASTLVLVRLLRSVVSCSPAVSGRRAGNIAAESSL